MRQIAWRIVIIQICFAASISGAINGKVSGNTYTSPGGLFKMEIPNKYNVKQRIDDYTQESEIGVIIRNDYANTIHVKTYQIPHASAQELMLPANKDQFMAVMDSIFHVVLEVSDVQSPEILKKEYFYDQGFGHAILRVIKTSENSGMVASEMGRECDAKTGFLFTVTNHHIVLVIVQASPVEDYIGQIIKQHSNAGNAKDPIDDLKDQLISVRRAIKFTEKAKT